MIEWFFNQISQALGVLGLCGALAAAYRWNKAIRKDFLMSFIFFMVGTSLREGVVYHWGNQQWGDLPLMLSALSRLMQVVGSIMFIRYATKDICPPWMLCVFMAIVACFVLAV